ncbi:MAG: hypothetical protein NC293_06475 [Roseburia sp.]|nr:hypothetical protein [Roseburia sp.]
MANEKILTIVKGEEFKVNIREKIAENDIFYDQYVKAARILDDIIGLEHKSKSAEWLKTETENNIIAFCGERGEGKSSAMISFINAVYALSSDEKSMLFSDCENIKKTLFSEPMVIDPSTFDDVHNVLDIVLATLYRKFREKYDSDNQSISVDRREELLDQFQKVYRYVSLINNQAQMRDNEYDYEGNISKLTKLGESTRLKSELRKLIELYLKIMSGPSNFDKEYKSLLIAIDDLDLCSSNAYKMAEQIRKYLIIPNVIIVMAIKVEQLRLCVQEENFRNYKGILRIGAQEPGVFSEISNMAERYVAKLIPRARRIYLPKVQTILHARILYVVKGKNNGEGDKIIYKSEIKDSMNEAVLECIFLRTGMKFLKNKSEENFLLPDNLRDMISIIALLGEMEDPKGDNSIYYENIQKFCSYYEKEWLPGNLDTEKCKEIQELIHNNYIKLHEGAEFALHKFYDAIEKKLITKPITDYVLEKDQSFSKVINWLEDYYMNVFGNAEERYAYAFHILYTIRLNQLLRGGMSEEKRNEEITRFMGGYMWAGKFINILPSVQGRPIDRSRFQLSTICAFNTIAKMISSDEGILLSDGGKIQNYVSKISDENREEKIWVWLLLGLLSNTFSNNQPVCTFYNTPIVYSNYSLLPNVQISLENYMVGLCNLENLREKINVEALGIEKEFDEFVDIIETYNKDTIKVFRRILMNIDLALKFKEYCQERKENKERGVKDETEKTKTVVNVFFRNVEKFMREYGDVDEKTKLSLHKLQCGEEGRDVDIAQLYGLLVEKSVKNYQDEQMSMNYAKKGEEVKRFLSKLKEKGNPDTPRREVSTYLRNKSAKNAKINIDNLALNLQTYYSNHMEELLESEIEELHKFYSKIMNSYMVDPTTNISDELYEEYKKIVSKYNSRGNIHG